METAYLEECQALAEAHPTFAPSAEAICEAVSILEKIALALDGLSPKARKAFLLRHVDGLKHKQIAQQLSVSKTMVQRYLVQGLVACHAVLQEEAGE